MRTQFFAAIILWFLLAGIMWLVFETTSKAQGLPDCRELLGSSYQRQLAAGDKALSIRQVENGAARIDYINVKTGLYTEYYLISDEKQVVTLQETGVYGSCMINDKSATMYVVRWLTMPNHPKRLINGESSGWTSKVHTRPGKVCDRWAHQTCT